jgi:spore germination protein YaaH
MKNVDLKNLCLFIFISFAIVACKEVTTLKSSARLVSSEMKVVQNSSKKFTKFLGMGDSSAQSSDTLTNPLAPINQKVFINKFNFLYDGLNGNKTNQYLHSLSYDSTTESYINQRMDQRVLREGTEVYTWYPYWMGDVWKSYDLNLISTISFFSYNIDPKTGNYMNPVQIKQWRETDLLDSAKKHNTKVLLSLALEGEGNHLEYLNNEASWNTTIDSIAVLLKERDADGIEIEFMDIPLEMDTKFLRFVASLKENLEYRFITKKMTLSLVIPAAPDKFPFDLEKLDESVDLFIVKGLDYHEEDGTVAAVAPLRNETAGGPSLETTLLTYLARGLNPEKSILALPLYGSQWSGTFDPVEGFYTTNFERKVTLSEVSRVFQSKDSVYNITPTLDETTMTNYFFLEFQDNTSIEGWYDDSLTLSKKMDLALVNKFKGVGLWALGYDLGKNEVWEVVAKKFTGDAINIKDPIKELDGYPLRIASFFQVYKTIFVVTFLLITLAIVIGLVIAFSDWRFRETILASQLYSGILLSIFCLLFLWISTIFGWINNEDWGFVLSFFAGAGIYYLVRRYGGMIKINKP